MKKLLTVFFAALLAMLPVGAHAQTPETRCPMMEGAGATLHSKNSGPPMTELWTGDDVKKKNLFDVWLFHTKKQMDIGFHTFSTTEGCYLESVTIVPATHFVVARHIDVASQYHNTISVKGILLREAQDALIKHMAVNAACRLKQAGGHKWSRLQSEPRPGDEEAEKVIEACVRAYMGKVAYDASVQELLRWEPTHPDLQVGRKAMLKRVIMSRPQM